MKLKRFLTVLTAIAMMGAMTACLEENTISETETDSDEIVELTDAETTEDTAPVDKNADETGEITDEGDEDEKLVINRSVRANETKMGEDKTWTIFVYTCGSDLESDNGMASMDFQEMMDSSANDNVRFVVQTGGSTVWKLDGIDADTSERFVIANGEMEMVWSDDLAYMGETETLADFLKWGVAEYPAANMGLVLWNHGGGSISGVCFDDYSDGDSLLLKEIDAALYSVYDDMTEKFEFIGFDACLMGTAEAAAILATHANYMIASQESEPGYGWNYTEIGNYLAVHPDADGAKIGRIICDSFYDSCVECDSESQATLSVIDLSKIDPFLTAFNDYAEELYNITENAGDFSEIARAISSADNFGGNNRASGYTNMVDAAGIINAGSSACTKGSAALSALEDAVVYKRNGSDHTDACGLSMYYPLQVQDGSAELSIFKDVALSPYYLGLVDKIAYGAVNSGNISDYDNSDVLDLFSNDWSADGFGSLVDGFFSYLFSEEEQWEYVDDFTPGENSSVEFDSEPAFDEDGNYGFTLSEDTLNNTDYVDAGVYLLSDDGDFMIDLGRTGDIIQDWSTGEFVDNFDGYWFCLPDEQLLAAYLYEECDGYDIYISPIKLNGEETYLRFVYDYVNVEVTIMDIWDGQDESGAAATTGHTLEDGDIIVPVYTLYMLDSDDEAGFDGDEFKYLGDDTLAFTTLPDGEYLYAFCINDIYGNYYDVDPVNFTVDGGDIYYSDLSGAYSEE